MLQDDIDNQRKQILEIMRGMGVEDPEGKLQGALERIEQGKPPFPPGEPIHTDKVKERMRNWRKGRKGRAFPKLEPRPNISSAEDILVMGFDLYPQRGSYAVVNGQGEIVRPDLEQPPMWKSSLPRIIDRLELLWCWVGIAVDGIAAAYPAATLTVAAKTPWGERVYRWPTLVLMWQLGMVHAIALGAGLDFLYIDPEEGLSALDGYSRATKAQMVEQAGLQCHSLADDEDAIGIALAGLEKLKVRGLSEVQCLSR